MLHALSARGRFACSLAALVVLLAAACTPPDANDPGGNAVIQLDLRNKKVQKIYDWRDRGMVDSLYTGLQLRDATLRYLSALAFASPMPIPDSTAAVKALAPLLQDPVEEIRIAAAFSLGQLRHPAAEKPLSDAFERNDSLSQHQLFNSTVLEAVGKCGGAGALKNMARISTYKTSDTLLQEGQCRGLYYFGLRGLTDPEGTNRMVEYVANTRVPAHVRLLAGHYLSRAKNVAPDSAQATLMAAALVRSAEPEVRAVLARALGRSKTGPAFGILSKTIQSETDWRVQCEIIKSLAAFDRDTTRSLVISQIGHANVHVARTAAEFFIENGQQRDGDYYWRISREQPNLPWEARVALFQASNRWLAGTAQVESRDFVNYRLREMFLQAKNPYERAACLQALAEFGWQYRWIHEKGFADPHPAVRNSAVTALNKILRAPDFYRTFGEGGRNARREIHAFLREAIDTGDPGLIAEASSGLQVKAMDFRSLRDTLRLPAFYAALGKLKLPRDYESYDSLAKAIAFFENKPAPPAPVVNWNHPIDWERLTVVSAASEVTLRTAKGSIVLELYPQWAPGTVAGFLELATTGFFDGKNFHRIVPDFVVQGGCPRGDGYGAPEFSLRTEIGVTRYESAGLLGMASAGANTEGSQFFITHSPTPHLSGKYTIFGRVKQGQDIVDQLQMGDLIEKVTVKYQ